MSIISELFGKSPFGAMVEHTKKKTSFFLENFMPRFQNSNMRRTRSSMRCRAFSQGGSFFSKGVADRARCPEGGSALLGAGLGRWWNRSWSCHFWLQGNGDSRHEDYGNHPVSRSGSRSCCNGNSACMHKAKASNIHNPYPCWSDSWDRACKGACRYQQGRCQEDFRGMVHHCSSCSDTLCVSFSGWQDLFLRPSYQSMCKIGIRLIYSWVLHLGK